MNRLTPLQIKSAAMAAGFEPRTVQAILKVETGGSGYDLTTGKLLIQFEPSWFRRKLSKARLLEIERARLARAAGTASTIQLSLIAAWETTQANGVEGQRREWEAFNAAFSIDKTAAMLSTSWGLPQMMGFNHAALGFATVDALVDSFRESEANQLAGMLRFIQSKPALARAVKAKDWAMVAYYYNGAGYKQFNYDRRLAAAYASVS
ncbi:N-acetylmuramidase family protein [Hymenobacter sp. BT635]|uniref:N-acetylmuramidase family protein n=1 Tax=Hymenobacter nitidus TaxID=2880929 RepID=A0ABS8AKN3_9BACT|nr:N-acetylmuramidase family protein [Hymenobacter nitidus]MCB2379805.1 N-acetylmuramidase family protein [Hymenobacter nitidus]